MSKKIMLFALAAVSATVLALPAMASAFAPLHLNPTPAGSKTIDSSGSAILSTSGSSIKVTCNGVSGGATFEAGGTTGTMTLRFGGACNISLGETCTSDGESAGFISTTPLPFHLVSVNKNPECL